jgi:hypothetical protein
LSGSGAISAVFLEGEPPSTITGSGSLTATGVVTLPPPLLGANFVVVLRPIKWEAKLVPPGGWDIVLAQSQIYASSLVQVPVNVTPPLLVNPTAFSVSFAFLSTDPPEPQPTEEEWVTGTWNSNITAPPYQALCLVGPGGITDLAAGTWNVWLQINSEGTGEIPVLYAGVLYVL